MDAKRILVGALVIAAALLGGLWLFLRHEPAAESLSAFQQTCIEGQRRAVTGQTLPLDDESEAKALGYCTCVAEEVETASERAQELAISASANPAAAGKEARCVIAIAATARAVEAFPHAHHRVLVPVIHAAVVQAREMKLVGGRDKPGNDDEIL